MTLQDLGNLGDFLGGIGVIITLLYLAAQIRQNTRQLKQNASLERLAALHATQEQGAALRSELAQPEVASLYLRGLSGDPDLTREESFRFRQYLHNIFFAMQATYLRYTAFEVDPGDWSTQHSVIREIAKSPGVQREWSRIRPALREDFLAEVEEVAPDLAGPAV